MQLWLGIEEFVRVVEKGSFTKAAKAMGFSRSHMSKHVQKLENRLGVTLIHRTNRQLKLTNQGQDFFLKCQAILLDLEEAQAQLANQVTTLRGHIRLTIAGAFGEDFICPIVADFLQDNKDVSVDITFSNRQMDLLEEQYDLAIRSFVDDGTNIEGEKLFSHKLMTAASPEYIAKHRKPKSIADLKSHNCLTGTLPYWRFKTGGRIQKITVKGNWSSNNGRALVHASKTGLGIIQVPDFYIKDELSKGELVEIFEPSKVASSSFWAIYPKSHHTPIKSQIFVTYIQGKLAQMR